MTPDEVEVRVVAELLAVPRAESDGRVEVHAAGRVIDCVAIQVKGGSIVTPDPFGHAYPPSQIIADADGLRSLARDLNRIAHDLDGAGER